ncbi:MAG: Calx-beta domain-containing protein, partial [Pseudanabaenaceae cyanobacterium]
DQNVTAATNLVVDRAVGQNQDNDGSNSTFPTITLAQSIINVPENAGFVEVPIDVIFPPGGRVATKGDYTIEILPGTATAGEDFTAITRTFNFEGANQTFRETLRIPIINDTKAEGLETFSVRISNSNGGFIGNGTTIVNIIDDDVSATVQVAPVTPNEGNTVTITVLPNGVFEPGEIRTVTIKTQDITAKVGEDFTTPVPDTLTFTFENSSPQTTTLRIIPDQINEQDESFQIIATGTRTVNGVTLPLVISGGIQTVTIREGIGLRISSVTPVVTEGLDRFAQVKVERVGDPSVALLATISVQGTGENGATPQRDFIPVSETVRFGIGDTTPRIISIPIIDNDVIQSSRSFLVTLTDARTDRPEFPPIREVITNVGSANPVIIERPDPRNEPNVPIPVLGGPVAVTILDNDGPNAAAGTAASRGSIQFERASYVVDEGQGFLDIRVQRVGGTSGAVNAEISLGKASGIGVAEEGKDFIFSDQKAVFFADGVGGFQTIRIPIIDDLTPEPTESFTLNLTEKRGESTLVVNSTVVQIKDNDGD